MLAGRDTLKSLPHARTYRALDSEDKELIESLELAIQKQEERGKQLRGQIEKAQSSIHQFMRSVSGAALLEE